MADIYIRNIENFRTAFAQGEYGHGYRDNTVTMAKDNNAVVALSGDYYSIRDTGVVIRNGMLYREQAFRDVCVLYRDGSMRTYSKETFDINEAVAGSAWQAWSFGPRLLENGQPMTNAQFDTDVYKANPRSALGYYEPGHYAFVLVDGRQEGYSTGMTLEELSQLFYDMGCQEAYNLGRRAIRRDGLRRRAGQPALWRRTEYQRYPVYRGGGMMLLRLWKRIRPLVPHLSIILCGLFVVLYVADRFNSNMNFIGNNLSKNLLLLLCIVTLISDIVLVRINRRRRK